MDSRAWLAHLEQFGIKLGLDTITAIVGALGHPERACPVLHVAGTNGKGSVSAMASHALTASGLLTACYTSPHLVRLEERFAIDGRAVSASALDTALDHVRHAVGQLHSTGALTVEPTFFEATTAAAFVLFRAAGAQLAVIEVGLGGTIRRDQRRRAAGDGDHLGGLRSPGAVGHDAGGNRRGEGGHDQARSSRGRRAAASRGARGG